MDTPTLAAKSDVTRHIFAYQALSKQNKRGPGAGDEATWYTVKMGSVCNTPNEIVIKFIALFPWQNVLLPCLFLPGVFHI